VSAYWERVSDDQRKTIMQLEKDQSEIKTMRDDLVKKLREVVIMQVKAEEQVAMLQHNLTLAEERQKADSVALAEQLELRQKIESLHKESQEREKAMQQEMEQQRQTTEAKAGLREGTLQKEIMALKQAIVELKAQQSKSIEKEIESNAPKTSSIELKRDPNEKIVQTQQEHQKAGNATKSQTSNATLASLEGGFAQNQRRDEIKPSRPDHVDLQVSVGLRPIRKFFAQTTGLHGFFSKKDSVPKQQPATQKRQVASKSLSQNSTTTRQAYHGERVAPTQPQSPMQKSAPLPRPGMQTTGPPRRLQQQIVGSSPQDHSPRHPPFPSQANSGGNRLSQCGSSTRPAGDHPSRGQVPPSGGRPTYSNRQQDVQETGRASSTQVPEPSKRTFGSTSPSA
jgi:VIT1/CCC1 family predicted Fe2+/Mn2+ transporter